MAIEFADVYYQGHSVGLVQWIADRRHAVFQYSPEFLASQPVIDLAPLRMPRKTSPYAFPELDRSFQGIPGMLADSLLDTYGNVLISDWLRRQGRDPNDFSPVEKLCYIGNRGMGALEYRPSLRTEKSEAAKVEVDRLVELAANALERKGELASKLEDEEDLNDILRVGTSAGGARAKAVIAWNPDTNEVRSGQSLAPRGFQHWILKFDGIDSAFDGNRDPKGYGRIEYAYHLMANAAGIEMANCRLFEESGRAHFMTRRFDRPDDGSKLHMASLYGINHMAYDDPWRHGHDYSMLFDVIEQLDLGPQAKLEAFRRMVFNVLACNRDDHSKNFGFLMDQSGNWRLSPAYDISYSHKPAAGAWTSTQQMSVSGKREDILAEDLIRTGRDCSVATRNQLRSEIERVTSAIGRWQEFAESAGVSHEQYSGIQNVISRQLRLSLGKL